MPAGETIVAPATAPGAAGVAIIRISGPQAFEVAARLHSQAAASLTAPRTLVHGLIKQAEQVIDQGLIVSMPSPNSYTGEDVVELQLHGSPAVVNQTVRVAIEAGARLAEPGEFTKRAFLNGKLDLAQAEAVADTIAATTQGALGLAQQHLAGSLSGQIEQARAEIVAIAAELSAWLDFSEEDLADIDRQAVTERLARIQDQLKAWISAGRTGAIVREGFRVAIIGLPNAGKSSLLNALAGYDRAIVTDVAGTTRDTLQETIEVEGLAVHIVDTAGLNDDPDQVEAIGIERALAAAGSAQLLIVTASADQYLEPLASNLEPLDSNKLLAVQTKVDVLTGPVDWPFKTDGTIRTSAKTGEGLNELRRRIYQAAIDEAELPSVLTANERHLAALRNCSELLSEVMSSLAAEAPLDVVAAGLTEAAQELTTIVGVNVGSEVIDAIFSRFCIGK